MMVYAVSASSLVSIPIAVPRTFAFCTRKMVNREEASKRPCKGGWVGRRWLWWSI